MKILALHLKRFVDYARLRGMSYKELLGAMKNPPADLGDPAAMIDAPDFYAVVDLMVRSLNDDLLGPRIGEHFSLNTLGAIYRISLKATTVQEALFYCQDYLRTTFPLIRVVNTMSGRSASIELSAQNDFTTVNRIILETSLTVIAREIKIISGEHSNVTIYSPYCHTDYPSGWKKGKLFAVKFQQTILKAVLLDNSRLGLDILIPEYLKLVEGMKPEKSLTNKIRIELLSMAKPALPDLEMIAGAFNLTSRTLQRRLVAEGTTFRQITEELKQQICELLIRHDRFSIADIAHVLGYSEPAAFIHSFKKWHGSSPTRLREKIAR